MALNTNLKTKDIEMTDDIKRYLAKRIAKLEQFIDEDDTTAIADIELARTTTDQRSGQVYRAEINLSLAKMYLRAEAESNDIRDAIDEMQEAIIREVKSEKGKRLTQIRAGARKFKKMIRNLYTSDDNPNIEE